MTQKQERPFVDAWTNLKNVLQAVNDIVPGVVAIAVILATLIILVALISSKLMMGVTILLVLFVSILIYTKTNNYGEAALSLVAGLLTVFTVEWTVSRFIVFTAIWVSFSLFALIISNIKLAAELESIYVHAAVSLSNNSTEITALAKRLQEIGNKSTPYRQLQAVQRAEAVRLLAFRKIPIDSLLQALAAIETFATVTKVDPKTITLFIADVVRILQAGPEHLYQPTFDRVLTAIRESAVPPEDFIKAFQHSRRLVLSNTLSPDQYFQGLREALEDGVDPEDMLEVLQAKLT